MNPPFTSPSGGAGSRRKSRHGMALLLVLSGVVLAAALVVSLLFLVKSGRIVSGAYAGQVQTRVLANSALNLVIGQIRDATGDTTMTQTWASQPGCIRVYSNGGSPPSVTSPSVDNFVAGYKLFSSSVMTETTEAALVGDVEGDTGTPVPTNWATEIGQYVNLNQPVTSTINGTTSTIYPIVDPHVIPGYTDPITGAVTPGTLGSPNGVTSISGVQGFSDTDTSNNYPNLAMPVEWLYQLQDGTLVPGLWQSDGSVQVGGSIHGTTYEQPSPTNPIVGRVAFWTDDETAKVNINTASEGLYWDEPRVNTQNSASTVTITNNVGGSGENVQLSCSTVNQYASLTSALTTPVGTNLDPSQNPSNEFTAVGTDQALAANQPAANEFNRFPGHPATTSLSAVFSELSPSQIFSLLPRYSLTGVTTTAPGSSGFAGYQDTSPLYTGGSVMGTEPWVYYASLPSGGNPNQDASNGYNATVSLNTNHLYSSGTEVMLQPARGLDSNGGMATAVSTSTITPAMVQQRKFFLTAESRAPELNLFGCPRVSMWPVYGTYNPQTLPNPSANGYPYCTAYDKMAAFCSTLQPSSAPSGTVYPFWFGRESATSPTTDMGITANANLYTYLQKMTSTAVPGFGGTFSAKYGTNGEINQILTEALDYIRCTNLFDASLEYDINGNPSKWMTNNTSNTVDSSGNEFTEGVHTYNVNEMVNDVGYPGFGQAVPLQNGSYMGLGRTYTVSQVALVFICTGDYNENGWNGGPGLPTQTTPAGAPPATGTGTTTIANGISAGGTLSNTNANITLDNTGSAKPLTGTYSAGVLQSWQRRVQAILMVELATPMEGYPNLCPSIEATILQKGGAKNHFECTGNSLGSVLAPGPVPSPNFAFGFPLTSQALWTFQYPAPNTSRQTYNPIAALLWQGIGSCGYGGIWPFLGMAYNPAPQIGNGQTFSEPNMTGTKSASQLPGGNYPLIPYYWISQPFTVTVSPTVQTMNLVLPTSLQIQLYYAPDDVAHGGRVASPVLYQTINVPFPPTTGGTPPAIPYVVPVPTLNQNINKWIIAQSPFNSSVPVPHGSNGNDGRLSLTGPPNAAAGAGNYDGQHASCSFVQPGDTVIAEAVVDGDFRLNAAMQTVPPTRFALVGNPTNATSQTLATATTANPLQGSTQLLTTPYYVNWIFPGFTFGDPMYFGKSYKVDVSNPDVDGTTSAAVRANAGSYVSGVKMPAFCQPEVPSSVTSVPTGDWDNGLGATPDGPFANMADSGCCFSTYSPTSTTPIPSIPYFDAPFFQNGATQRSFSPNRIVPSPGMFGSLPTGVTESKPWQTLRFRPQSSGSISDPDYAMPETYSTSIPDYLFMDLFWMPVVAPYAISEPFSTAGKINMNYQILPFTYIKRQTGLYAVLKHERILAVPSNTGTAPFYTAASYKADMLTPASNPGGSFGYVPLSSANSPNFPYPTGGVVQTSDSTAWRHQIDVPSTLVQFDNVFNNNQIFVSPTQLCDLYLVPQNGDAASLGLSGSSTAAQVHSAMSGPTGYWSTHLLTGDNSRERPYTVIYPRLTTQSNTYRVHYWVQTLKKASAGTLGPTFFIDPNGTYAGAKDSIRGQLRGSFLIERYLQSDDSRNAFATWCSSNYPTPTSNLNSFYKIRILGSTDFSPQ